MKKEVLFTYTFPSERNIRKKILETVSAALASLDLSLLLPGDEIILAVDEAITNAMEHGNNWDPQKKINIEIISNSSSINIRITDEGDGFKPLLNTEKNVRELKPRGHGLYLMTRLCKATWNKKGNSVNLKFFFKACG
ncbi:MAG TPA: ATP-binding protein [Spirochaetota bacterium]|nr:ATP-binding protein [Spirochaetota bacterium]HPI89303.1 ATP-binding protein [Spirochaetota bacterium]HPR48540.1 ATP-binding protein [Spirochaetota bacterium]